MAGKAIHLDREEARKLLTDKIVYEQKILDQKLFSTYDPRWIIEDAKFRLRWIDCAPEGANHLCAPLQDKNGVPMGGNYNENVGPGQNLREARKARGLNPFVSF